MSLKEFPLHRPGIISEIDTTDDGMLQKLVAIGALPRTTIEVLQRRPSFVLRMGYATFAIDDELASCIHVEEENN